jgi:hypothetical protein
MGLILRPVLPGDCCPGYVFLPECEEKDAGPSPEEKNNAPSQARERPGSPLCGALRAFGRLRWRGGGGKQR